MRTIVVELIENLTEEQIDGTYTAVLLNEKDVVSPSVIEKAHNHNIWIADNSCKESGHYDVFRLDAIDFDKVCVIDVPFNDFAVSFIENRVRCFSKGYTEIRFINTRKYHNEVWRNGSIDELMKYRKKPVEVEAMQFTSETMNQVFHWVSCNKAADHDPKTGLPILKIQTLEGVMTAELGDYIIKGVQGEFYPCKPDIFEQTYELVES